MAEPKFDPKMGFQLEEPSFDPTAAFSEEISMSDSASGVSPWESGLRGAGQGLSLGFADEITGGLESLFTDKTYEQARDESRANYKKAKEANPGFYTAGEIGGGVATALIPGMNIAKGASLAKAAGQAALQGGLMGLGNSEASDAKNLALDTAGGAAVGGILGGSAAYMLPKLGGAIDSGVKKIGNFLGPRPSVGSDFALKQTVKAAQDQTADAAADAIARSSAEISGGGGTSEVSGELFGFKTPQTLDELRNWKPSAGAGELPGKQRLSEIIEQLPDLEAKPLKYHFDMMENPKAMKKLKLDFENLPTEDAQKIAAYNQAIVDETSRKVGQTIDSISGAQPKNLSDAGNDLISVVKDKYNAEKDALGPIFQQLQESGGSLSKQDSRDLIQAIGSNSKIGRLLSQDDSGRFFLNKNTPRTGVSDSEYGVISRVIDDLNDGMSFKEIQDTRDFLRKAIDPSNPHASAEVSKIRSVLLDQLEHMSGQKYGPDVAQTFKSYAINERNRENIEKIIGGKIESLDSMFAANPERVVQKIFSNPNYSKIVGDYVGPDKMKELVASYISSGVQKSFDSAKGFSPSMLKSWLKNNEAFLSANADPAVKERLAALADYGYYGKRFLDEVNPSGTAASLKEMLEPRSFAAKVQQQGVIGALTSEATGRANALLKQKQAQRSINEALGAPRHMSMSDKISENLLNSPRMSELYSSNPSVFNMLVNKMDSKLQESLVADTESKPFDQNALLQKTQGTKYSQALQNASQRGKNALGAAHFVLQSQDPEYRKLVLGEADEHE